MKARLCLLSLTLGPGEAAINISDGWLSLKVLFYTSGWSFKSQVKLFNFFLILQTLSSVKWQYHTGTNHLLFVSLVYMLFIWMNEPRCLMSETLALYIFFSLSEIMA